MLKTRSMMTTMDTTYNYYDYYNNFKIELQLTQMSYSLRGDILYCVWATAYASLGVHL